jgi:hypothetical protein
MPKGTEITAMRCKRLAFSTAQLERGKSDSMNGKAMLTPAPRRKVRL